jgi:hypothetical protein
MTEIKPTITETLTRKQFGPALNMAYFANSLARKPISTGDAHDAKDLRRPAEFK